MTNRIIINRCPYCDKEIMRFDAHEYTIQKSSRHAGITLRGYEIWFHKDCFIKNSGKRCNK